MERAPLAGTQMREGGGAGAGTPDKGGESRKADYQSGDAEPRSRLQPFPEKRKRRRRGERGGRERPRREVVALRPRARVLGRAPPVGQRPEDRGGHRSRGGEAPCLSWLARRAAQFLPAPRPNSFPGRWRGKAR